MKQRERRVCGVIDREEGRKGREKRKTVEKAKECLL